MKKIRVSSFILVVVMCIVTFSSIRKQKWKKEEVIQYDVWSYYSYLPAFFIYNDLTFDFIKKLPEPLKGNIWYEQDANGVKYQKMTMGLAILWAPFFLTAKEYYKFIEVDDYGFGKHYQHAIAIAGLFYVLIGLIFLRKLLLVFFSDVITAFILCSIVLCTNLFYYTVVESGMSHLYSFSLISLFLWLSVKWNQNYNSLKYLILLSIIGGLIVLIRPINGLILLFPLFYNFSTLEFKNKFLAIIKSKYIIPLAVVFFLLPILPQLLYWKFISGHFIFYSYGEEHFFFLKSHVWDGLFSFRKGLFIYTPFMLFMVPGLFIALFRKYPFAKITLIIIPLFVYVSFSWWCWWYGGTFGARTMVDFYALFCLLVGCFYKEVFKNKWAKIFIPVFTVFFIWLNLLQSYQFETHVLHYDAMTKESYFKIFGKTEKTPDFDKFLNHPDIQKASTEGE